VIERRIDKNRFSEYVVRQALYWMSHRASWQLSESEQEWIVQFESPLLSGQ
jgi:His-Xaa-Ser system protein HxsD